MPEILGNGTTVEYKTTGSYATLGADVTSVKFSKLTRARIDNTHLASTSKTTQPGLVDYGTVDVQFYYNPTTYDLVDGWLALEADALSLKVILSDEDADGQSSSSENAHTVLELVGYVSDLDPVGDVKIDEKLVCTFTFAINAFTATAAL